MAGKKDNFGLDIPVPKPPAGRKKRERKSVSIIVPRGYKASQKRDIYKRIDKRQRKKKKKSRKKSRAYEVPPFYSKVYEDHKKKVVDVVTSFFTQEMGAIVDWLKDMTNVRRKVRKTMHYHAFLTAGIVVLLFGIAKYVECLCPTLICGMGYMIVGLIALIAALVYNRFY